jgi:hypothetical protein
MTLLGTFFSKAEASPLARCFLSLKREKVFPARGKFFPHRGKADVSPLARPLDEVPPELPQYSTSLSSQLLVAKWYYEAVELLEYEAMLAQK